MGILLRLREKHNALQLPVLSSSSSFSCFSGSRVRNIGASHIQDLVPCHNVKSHVSLDFFIPSENGFAHFKEHLERQAMVDLWKKAACDLVAIVQCRN